MLIKYTNPAPTGLGTLCINFSQVFSFQHLGNKIYFDGHRENALIILDFLSEEEAKKAFEKIVDMADFSTSICDLDE